MKRIIVSLVATAALAVPVGWTSVAGAKTDPDANGDVQSNCHTGSKFRGAGGEDEGPGRPKDTSDNADCAAAPVTPVNPVTPAAAPGAPAAAGAPRAPAAAPARAPAQAAVPVAAAPRTTG